MQLLLPVAHRGSSDQTFVPSVLTARTRSFRQGGRRNPMSAAEPDVALQHEHAANDQQRACGRLRVVLVDDNSEFAGRVAGVLGKDFEIVGTFDDGESLLRELPLLELPQTKPNAIILDVSMGELSGIEVARRLKQSKCGARIVFLSVHESSEFVSAAWAAGASGYVFKTHLGADLIPAIVLACSGNLFVSSKQG